MKTKRADSVEEQTYAGSSESPARELHSILVRGKWTIMLVFLVVTGAVAYQALRTPPLYEAESSLMVRIGREYVYRSELGRTETARTPSLSEMVNSEVEILSSRDLAEQVVRQIGVQRLYPQIMELETDPQRAAEVAVVKFRQSASIRPVLESSVIKVGFEHPVPQVAADAVNLLVDRFKDKHVEVFGEERAGRLETQLKTRAEELVLAENALSEFKTKNNVFDLDEQRSLLLSRRVRLEEALDACELQLTELRMTAIADGDPSNQVELPPHLLPEMKGELLRQRLELEQQQRALAPIVPDRVVEDARLRLLDLRLEESRLLADYNEDSRHVLSIRNEIEQVTAFKDEAERRAGTFDGIRLNEQENRSDELVKEIDRLKGEVELLVRFEEQRAQAEVRVRLQVLQVQRDDFVRRMGGLEQQIQTLDQSEKTLRQLDRALSAAEAAFEIYGQRTEEARISDELDREKQINVRVIEMAAPPVAPSGLPRNLKIALGAFVGLLAGAGLAVLLDLFRAR